MRKHTAALKYTTYTRSILTVSSKQLIVWRVFRVGRVCVRWDGGTFCSRTASEQRERAVNCNKMDSWTAGSMLGSRRLCVRASTHAYVNVGRQRSALLTKVKLQSLTQTGTKSQISTLIFFFKCNFRVLFSALLNRCSNLKTALQITRIKVIINYTILRFTFPIKSHSWETHSHLYPWSFSCFSNIFIIHCHWREHKLYSLKQHAKAKAKIIPKWANFFCHNYYKASATEFVYALFTLIFNMFCSMNLRHRTNVEQTNGKLQVRSRVFVLLAPWNVLQRVGGFLAFSLAVTLLWVH